jgi:cardiolipin synthase
MPWHHKHPRVIVIDGSVGFLRRRRHRRSLAHRQTQSTSLADTIRVEGPCHACSPAFAENLLEARVNFLTGTDYFPPCPRRGEARGCVAPPSASNPGRVVSTLLASAGKSIHITTPYFLPDYSVRQEIIRAITERGVEVRVVAPGKHMDHLLTRRSSRRLYGQLLEAGAQIYEYSPSMIHTKSMIVDGIWSVVGSTNFDNRSFGLNDEVNLSVFDERVAARLEVDFARDVEESVPVTFEDWRQRSIAERAH